MIPWYVYVGTTALLILGYVVNRAAVFLIGALLTGGMISPIAMGLVTPIWLELIVLFPALCLILAFIGGPTSESEAMPSDRPPDDGGPIEPLSNGRSE